MSLETRLHTVQDKIRAACKEAGRAPSEVRLIAVSKTRPASAIETALQLGQIHYGENYAQELRDKVKVLGPSSDIIKWHYIGRIQRNKAKYIAPSAYRVHTLESVEQAEALLKRASHGLDALLAVNIGREPQKSGLLPEHIIPLAQALHNVPNCRIHGLMCLPPIATTPQANAPYFEEMAYWMSQGQANGFKWDELSMGMSSDYPVAIRYGATWIRVGTALFGPRT